MADPEVMMTFCEGCPFANGVVEVGNTYKHNFQMQWPNPGFEISFQDKNNPSLETQTVDVQVEGDVDSSMPQGTLNVIREDVRHCVHPEQVQVKRLGGLAGTKTVQRCGAFPDQKPAKVKMRAITTGWFHAEDFI